MYCPRCNYNSFKCVICNLKKEMKSFSLNLQNSFTARSKHIAFEIKALYISKTRDTIEKVALNRTKRESNYLRNIASIPETNSGNLMGDHCHD